MKNNNITNEQHERLCAYLFGELTGDERASFEAELGASAELTDEKARIEASMNLVREFAPEAPVALSDGMRATLAAAAAKAGSARPGPTLAWYNHPGLQVAAATVVAVFAFRALDSRLLDNGFGVRREATEGIIVADLDISSTADELDVRDFRPLTVKDRHRDGLAEVGYLGASGAPKKSGNGRLQNLGYAESVSEADAESLRGLGYLGKAPSSESTFGLASKGGVKPAASTAAKGPSETLRVRFDQGEDLRGEFLYDAERGLTSAKPVDLFKGGDIEGLKWAPLAEREPGQENDAGVYFADGGGEVKAAIEDLYDKALVNGQPAAAPSTPGAPLRESAGKLAKGESQYPLNPGVAVQGGALTSPAKPGASTPGNLGATLDASPIEGLVAGTQTRPLASEAPEVEFELSDDSFGSFEATDGPFTKSTQGVIGIGGGAGGAVNGAPAIVTDAEVAEAKEELARFEVDAKARKKQLLAGGEAVIGSSLAELDASLKSSELAVDETRGSIRDADLSTAMASTTNDPVTFVDSPRKRNPGGGGGGRLGPEATGKNDLSGANFGMIPEEQADDFFAGLKLRLTDGSVDMPAARARLVQLEEAEVADKLRNIVFDEDEKAGLSDDEKITLEFLRGYIEEADQAALRAERDRINAQRRRAMEVEREYLTILQRCVPRAGEKPSAMYYRYWGDNGYEFPIHDALSTFAVDVDTASYTLARRYLQDGYLPERAQIRTEEFVNYATPDLAAPTNGDVFNVSMELAPSPFGPSAEDGGEHMLLRVGVRGMEVDKSERDPVALTFVVDVSGSMKTDNRLELVKHSLRLLVGELRPTDSIALITFNNTAKRVLDMTSVGNGAAIERALYDMRADGGTNAEAGLTLGFAEAVVAHTQGAQNRVVFLSDGVGNIGETNENQLLEDARRAREKGIYLNTIGFGMTNHNDRFLEQLANGGDGLCNYVDSPDEAQRALVDNFTGAFQTIARDVKIQVEFNKSQVLSYRQLGYENRAIADSDFRNDKVDAGEIGAGHQVVALYEIVLRDTWTETRSTPLATARVRYKVPYGELEEGAEDSATEIFSTYYYEQTSTKFDGASIGFQKSALAAQFAEFLRRSSHAKGDSVSLLRYRLEELAKATNDPELIELSALVQLAQPQLEPALLVENQIRRRADELQRFEYECQSQAYIYDNTTDEWLAKTTATRSHLREELRREVYGAYGMED